LLTNKIIDILVNLLTFVIFITLHRYTIDSLDCWWQWWG